jgi:hypothetical protein
MLGTQRDAGKAGDAVEDGQISASACLHTWDSRVDPPLRCTVRSVIGSNATTNLTSTLLRRRTLPSLSMGYKAVYPTCGFPGFPHVLSKTLVNLNTCTVH